MSAVSEELRALREPERVDLPCPSWCDLEPGHPWDSATADGVDTRSHSGPNFGDHAWADAEERADNPGQLTYSVGVSAEAVNYWTAEQVRAQAVDLHRAAAWLEEHTTANGTDVEAAFSAAVDSGVSVRVEAPANSHDIGREVSAMQRRLDSIGESLDALEAGVRSRIEAEQ